MYVTKTIPMYIIYDENERNFLEKNEMLPFI